MDEEENKHHFFEGEAKTDTCKLPVGFRFQPTDKEIVADYLLQKIRGRDIPWTHPIVEVELSKYHPDGLTEKYAEKGTEGVWYFFARRVKKYRNGTQADRSAVNGYWKATEADKAIEIFLDGGMNGKITGMKKTLVFFNVDGDTTVRKNKEGRKTAWTMYEYRITGFVQSSPETKFQDYVLCKIYRSKRSRTRYNNMQLQQVEQPEQIVFREPENAVVPTVRQYPEPSNQIPYPLTLPQPLPMAETLTEQPESYNYMPFSVQFPELFQDGYGYSNNPVINYYDPSPGKERAVVQDRDLFEFLNSLPPVDHLQGLD